MADEGTLIAGHRAGRIQPTGWTPPDGDWCFLIGSESADVEDDVEIGDIFGVEQEVFLGDVRTLSFAMKLRNTPDPAIDFKASLNIGGSEVWSEQIAHGETREYVRRTVNVSHLTGVQVVSLRLEAV